MTITGERFYPEFNLSEKERGGKPMFQDAVILVAGGTGSCGTELVRKLLELKPRKSSFFPEMKRAMYK